MGALMIIIVSACGQMGSGGTGCGVAIEAISFSNVGACEVAREALFPPPPPEASRHEREGYWQPRREIKCVRK